MNSYERVMAILRREPADRPALIAPVSNATAESCARLGFDFSEAHIDSDKAAALAAYPHERLGFDSVMPYFSVVLEAAALGAPVDWGGTFAMPAQTRPLYREPGDFALPADFLDRAPVAALLRAIRLLKRKYRGSALVLGKVFGPWTLGLRLYGMEDFLADTLLDPPKVRAFIDRFTDITLCFARAQLEAGADMLTLADHITADVAGPRTYAGFLQGAHRRIIGAFPADTFILHCCGRTTDRIALFADAGFPVFHFESRNDVAEALRAAGNMLLTGCVNNPVTLLSGTPGEVRAQTRGIIAGGIRLVSPECALPLEVPNANLLAVAQAVRESA